MSNTNIKYNLYLVQDPDRPLHVVAQGWVEALTRWKYVIAAENYMGVEDVEEPSGIMLVCDHDELILNDVPENDSAQEHKTDWERFRRHFMKLDGHDPSTAMGTTIVQDAWNYYQMGSTDSAKAQLAENKPGS